MLIGKTALGRLEQFACGLEREEVLLIININCFVTPSYFYKKKDDLIENN